MHLRVFCIDVIQNYGLKKFLEIQMGGGVLALGNPGGRGGLAALEFRVEGGGSKKHAIRQGVWIFSGITH